MIAVHLRLEQNELIQSCRKFTQVLRKPTEFCEGLVVAPRQRHTFPFHLAEGLLYVAEEAPGSR